MPNRIIKESICTSDNIDQLTPFQEVVFYRLMVNCDDFGRYDARAKLLSSRLFPLRDIDPADIDDALDALQKADLIIVYSVDGKPYLQMKTWGKHQQPRAAKSKFPSPDDESCNQLQSNDINCNQLQSDDGKCPRNRNRNRYPINDNRESISISEEFISDDEAHRIQKEQDEVLNAAGTAGFKLSKAEIAALLDGYAQYGRKKMLDGIESCMRHGATTIAYLDACLKGEPRKKKKQETDYEGQRDYSAEQDEAMKRMISAISEGA